MKAPEALPLFVEAFVPLCIAELEKRGGPTAEELLRVQSYVSDLCKDGDALLYRRKDETGRLAGELLEIVAVLAFQPGGITVFGQHWETHAN